MSKSELLKKCTIFFPSYKFFVSYDNRNISIKISSASLAFDNWFCFGSSIKWLSIAFTWDFTNCIKQFFASTFTKSKSIFIPKQKLLIGNLISSKLLYKHEKPQRNKSLNTSKTHKKSYTSINTNKLKFIRVIKYYVPFSLNIR